MKRIILFFSLCLITTLASFAQTVLPAAEPETSFLIDLGSFTGIVALISTLVTQIMKIIPADSPVTEGDACQQFYILCLHTYPAASAVESAVSGSTPGG